MKTKLVVTAIVLLTALTAVVVKADDLQVCGKITKFENQTGFCTNKCQSNVIATLAGGQKIEVQASVSPTVLITLIASSLTACFDKYGYLVSVSGEPTTRYK